LGRGLAERGRRPALSVKGKIHHHHPKRRFPRREEKKQQPLRRYKKTHHAAENLLEEKTRGGYRFKKEKVGFETIAAAAAKGEEGVPSCDKVEVACKRVCDARGEGGE